MKNALFLIFMSLPLFAAERIILTVTQYNEGQVDLVELRHDNFELRSTQVNGKLQTLTLNKLTAEQIKSSAIQILWSIEYKVLKNKVCHKLAKLKIEASGESVFICKEDENYNDYKNLRGRINKLLNN
jgi:hypothetical protein